MPLLSTVGLGELRVLVQPVGIGPSPQGSLLARVRGRLSLGPFGLPLSRFLFGRRARGRRGACSGAGRGIPGPPPALGPGLGIPAKARRSGAGEWGRGGHQAQLGAVALLACAQAGLERRGVLAGPPLLAQPAQHLLPVVRAAGGVGGAALGLPAVGALQARPVWGLAAQRQLFAHRGPWGGQQELPAARVPPGADEAARGAARRTRGRLCRAARRPLVPPGDREETATQQQQ